MRRRRSDGADYGEEAGRFWFLEGRITIKRVQQGVWRVYCIVMKPGHRGIDD